MKIMNTECKRQIQVAQEPPEKKGSRCLTGRQIAYMICAFFKINDVQGKALGLNDLWNIALRSRQLEDVRPSLGRSVRISC